MDNIWNSIPLEDYEQHMLHETVGQLQLLNDLTKKYLEATKPNTVLILGVAGGNGLEHIDKTITREVIGIDINDKYLEENFLPDKKSMKTYHFIKNDEKNMS